MIKYVCDLDNTIIETSILNNEAYNYSLTLNGYNEIKNKNRITRKIVKQVFNLNRKQLKKIIKDKQSFFIANLNKCKVNTKLILLIKHVKSEDVVIWTSASKQRVKAILDYLDLSWVKVLYSKKINVFHDVKKICRFFKCDKKEIIVYEDNKEIVDSLKQICISCFMLEK